MSEYKPTKAQMLAKARLYKYLAENKGSSLEDMTIEAMEHHSKARSLSNWLGQEGFQEWWMEKSAAMAKVAVGVELAVERLLEILSTPASQVGPKEAVSVKDQLAAADKIFQLADLYPKKRIVERFLDKNLEKLDAEETAAETRALENKLRLAEKKP